MLGGKYADLFLSRALCTSSGGLDVFENAGGGDVGLGQKISVVCARQDAVSY
jgi:hypothetical protein